MAKMEERRPLMDRVEVIAEIANAHQGSPLNAYELAMRSLDAGASAVKFQIYAADELLVKSHPRYDHFLNQSFSDQTWENLISKIRGAGGRVYCDVFGIKALKLATELEVEGYKIHSTDLANIPLLQLAAQVCGNKRLLLSTGGCSVREIYNALGLLDSLPKVTLLHGFQAFPTSTDDSNLRRILSLKEIFPGYSIGYQDHTDGSDIFASILPLMAVALGATVIEKHVTLDRKSQGVDYYSSVEPQILRQFIADIRRAGLALGEVGFTYSDAELSYRSVMKKRWVAARDLKEGTILSIDDLVMKRSGIHDSEVPELDQLVGRVLNQNISFEDPVSRDKVSSRVIAVVVARTRSQRLPNKALLPVNGVPAVQHLLLRLKQAESLDRIILCTTGLEEDDPLIKIAEECGVPTHRGASENVLDRIYGAISEDSADVIVRITGDDIMVDPEYLDYGVKRHLESGAEYSDLKGLPSGTEVEFFDRRLLETIFRFAFDLSGTEYLTYYVTENRGQFKTNSIAVRDKHHKNWRLTIDTLEDYLLVTEIIDRLAELGLGESYRLDDIVRLVEGDISLRERCETIKEGRRVQINTSIDWARLAN